MTINGEVIFPGTYEYADNTPIEDLIIQAGGLKDGASLARVDVSRRIEDPLSLEKPQKIAETYRFDLKDGLALGKAREFKLMPFDIVHVRRSPGFVMPKNITVNGEVNFEGKFTLEKKNLRLTDAISMAGGVTQDAYIRGARLIRKMSEDEFRRQQAIYDALTNNLTSKSDSISFNKIKLDSTYVIGIELDKALEKPGSDFDVVLREGDQIEVPEYNSTIRIAGDVQFPNTITFVEGKNYKWYVDKAGGFSETAKKKKSFIIYPNGMMAKLKSRTTIEPGSEIVVPSKKRSNSWKISEWLGFSNILTSLASATAMIAYLTK